MMNTEKPFDADLAPKQTLPKLTSVPKTSSKSLSKVMSASFLQFFQLIVITGSSAGVQVQFTHYWFSKYS